MYAGSGVPAEEGWYAGSGVPAEGGWYAGLGVPAEGKDSAKSQQERPSWAKE